MLGRLLTEYLRRRRSAQAFDTPAFDQPDPWFAPGMRTVEPADGMAFADRRLLAARIPEPLRREYGALLHTLQQGEIGLGLLVFDDRLQPQLVWRSDAELDLLVARSDFDELTRQIIRGAQAGRVMFEAAGLLVVEPSGAFWSVLLDRDGGVVAVMPGVDEPSADELRG